MATPTSVMILTVISKNLDLMSKCSNKCSTTTFRKYRNSNKCRTTKTTKNNNKKIIIFA